MVHPKTVEKYSGTIEELAKDIGNLDYGSLKQLYTELGYKLANDAEKDKERGRVKLSSMLEKLADLMISAEMQTEEISNVCINYNKRDE